MSMQALNQLVARSIIDPSVVQAVAEDNITSLLEDFGFSDELKTRLSDLHATSFAEFSILAYRTVKAAEEVAEPRIQLPSPMEGLFDDRDQAADDEQVA